jgi:hypothetical protein
MKHSRKLSVNSWKTWQVIVKSLPNHGNSNSQTQVTFSFLVRSLRMKRRSKPTYKCSETKANKKLKKLIKSMEV